MKKYYANKAFIFDSEDIWSFYKFLHNFPDDQKILLEKDFYDELQSKENNFERKEQEQISQKLLTDNKSQFVELNNQKRNYAEEYLKFINFELYTQEIELVQLKYLLMLHCYIDLYEIKIYEKYEKYFLIESGRIFGVPFVFYDAADKDHKHSLYLVDYLQKSCWTQLYRKIRLSQEVKKQFLLVFFDDKDEIQMAKLITNFR